MRVSGRVALRANIQRCLCFRISVASGPCIRNGKTGPIIHVQLKSSSTKVLNVPGKRNSFLGDPHPTPVYPFLWESQRAA